MQFYRRESELIHHVNSLEEYLRVNAPTSIKEAQSEGLTGIRRSETQVREFLKKTPCSLSESRDDAGQSRPRRASRLSGQ